VIAKDPKASDMYKAMVDADGKPVVCDDVWIAYSYGDFPGNPVGKKSGKLTAGTEEFKGNVANVYTVKYWPVQLDAILTKSKPLSLIPR